MQKKFLYGNHLISRNKRGNIDTVLAQEKVILETSVGSLVPRYSLDDQSRKKESPVKFYKTGELKSVPLESATEVATPIQKIQCELVTFYKTGSVWRVFPLDGQMTGYWTEENEYKLASNIDIPTPLGILNVKPIYLQFYETGELESILFWPDEQIGITISVGEVEIHKGICFYKNGNIKGFEPVDEFSVTCPIGVLKVFDPDPNGIHAERHSINFYGNGDVQSVITVSNQVKVTADNGACEIFSPKIVSSYCKEDDFFISPLNIHFGEKTVTFINDNGPPLSMDRSFHFEIADYIPNKPISCVGCE
ncbi:hypothetical protein JWJ90_09360 [Desulfobulbus rhabdoformis]|uniref:hypothetical protein n=1 Tax=Desulfobulbus rhabdoformis TaxID=34032 RepID=UPI0019627203|nr:hypothetical protein [Desulfobulbus rhabdoformis]MBM9614497.1 hypothetical protein [Desulfobulbus rhabdoformis]